MTVGLLLLTSKDQYLKEDGSLPSRPAFDKGLLEALMHEEVVWCTQTTWDSMPNRMKHNALGRCKWNYTLNLGIGTMYTEPPKLLIIVRSKENFEGGRTFDLNQWKLLVKQNQLDIYILKTS